MPTVKRREACNIIAGVLIGGQHKDGSKNKHQYYGMEIAYGMTESQTAGAGSLLSGRLNCITMSL